MSYCATMLGELRLLEAFGFSVPRPAPRAILWTPQWATLDRVVATMLQRVRNAGRPLSLASSWRRTMRKMAEGFRRTVPEYDWFEEVPS